MSTFTMARHINAPPETVFDVFADFEHAAQHIGGIDRLEVLTPGTIGVGTRFRETRTMFKKQATEEMEITAYERPTGYSVSCFSCGSLFVSTFRFLPSGKGTNVEMEFDCESKSLFAKLMSPFSGLMLGVMKKAIARDLEDLTAVAQRQAEATADPAP